MFTSRAEYRLLLRADNADERLTALGRELGLVNPARWAAFQARRAALDAIRERFERVLVHGRSLREIARRPETSVQEIAGLLGDAKLDHDLVERVITESRYDGYITRQRAEVRRQREADSQRIPNWLEPHAVTGLRRETVETLARFRPQTIGQASRLAGVTPADITLLAVHIRRGRKAVGVVSAEPGSPLSQ